ncbi:hypothetical protein CBR_g58793 [Chara braunii]|uniref:Uncharacterized protein n=1 Tax=Chara braunii TaxID=69332 RepID=A0A388K8A8_CHABU|nr:hypothetical protein CBR_g58793 [Chara braunii]|eukprot:GBG66302.1 hypothetical protein CBR_g58793 [Chara braunii]
MRIKLQEAEEYVVSFKPWLPLQELREVRLQEAEVKFWIMALRVPIDAYYYLRSAVQGIFGEVVQMYPPEYDRSRPKLMNVKLELSPDARHNVEDVLTIEGPTGEKWRVEIATPYTDWCRRCKWYFHTDSNCPRTRQGDERGNKSAVRPGGHKVRFSEHLQKQEDQARNSRAARREANSHPQAGIPTTSHISAQAQGLRRNNQETASGRPRWDSQEFRSTEVQEQGGQVSGAGRWQGQFDQRYKSANIVAGLGDPQGVWGQYNQSDLRGAFATEEQHLHDRFGHKATFGYGGAAPMTTPGSDRVEWQAGNHYRERDFPQAAHQQEQDPLWGAGPQEVQAQYPGQAFQDTGAPHMLACPYPRYPPNSYNWRDLIPHSREEYLERPGPSWRAPRPGLSRLGKSTSRSESRGRWRSQGRADGGSWRDQGERGEVGDWREHGQRRREELQTGPGDLQQAAPRAASGDQRVTQEGRHRLADQAVGRGDIQGELSRTSASSQSRVRWGSEWYVGEKASEESEGERSSMLSSATSKSPRNEERMCEEHPRRDLDRRADTARKSQAEKVQRRIVPLLCTMAKDGVYFLALAQADGVPVLPSFDVEHSPTPSEIVDFTRSLYGQHVSIRLIPRSIMVSLTMESREQFYKLYFPLLDARIPSELASSLTQAGVRWVHMSKLKDQYFARRAHTIGTGKLANTSGSKVGSHVQIEGPVF